LSFFHSISIIDERAFDRPKTSSLSLDLLNLSQPFFNLLLPHTQPVPGACRVVATFAERPRLSLNTGTYVQGTEGSVELLASLLNAGGRAERITLAFEKGSRQLDEASLTVERRRPWGYPCSVDAGIHQRSRSWAPTASFDETSRSFSTGVASADGRHAVAYELAWRSLADATRRASASVKAQAGNSLKSALRYTRRFGGTEGEGCREEGMSARASVEVAGVGAALASSSNRSSSSQSSSSSASSSLVRHFRQQVAASFFHKVSESVCLELTADAGVLLPFDGGGGGGESGGAGGGRRTAATTSSSSSSSISDRFFLGGVGGGLRGFGIRACGPTDQRHGISAAAAAAAAASSRPASAAASPVVVPLSARGSDLTGAAAARAEADARSAAAAAAAASQSVDFVGADLSVSVLAALRFELPWRQLREIGIFGHLFANGAGMSLLGGGNVGSGRTNSGASASSSAASSPVRGAPSLSSSSSFPLAGAVAAAAGELRSTWRWSAVSSIFFSFCF